MGADLGALADRLDAISEELADTAIDLLKEAVRKGAPGRPAEEKRIAQARRAIDKAAHILRGMEEGDDG